MSELQLLDLAAAALNELKARDVRVLDVRSLTSITDHMVVATGTSGRHVRSIAEKLIEGTKKAGKPPLGVEGQEGGEWVLVDMHDVVVHIMQRRAREFYKLEDLWAVEPSATIRGVD